LMKFNVLNIACFFNNADGLIEYLNEFAPTFLIIDWSFGDLTPVFSKMFLAEKILGGNICTASAAPTLFDYPFPQGETSTEARTSTQLSSVNQEDPLCRSSSSQNRDTEHSDCSDSHSDSYKVKSSPISSTKAEEDSEAIFDTMDFDNDINEIAIKKEFMCEINVDFPNSEVEKQNIQKKIQNIVHCSIISAMDLTFVKDIILEEHTEEIVNLDFKVLDLEKLPWNLVIFKATNIERGSTILKFSLEFKELPKDEFDANTYRLIELVIITIIENLQFIKSVRRNKINENKDNLVLSATIKAHEFDEDLFKDLLNTLRGSIKEVVDNNSTEEDAETFLESLLSTKSDEVTKLMNYEFTPRSMRNIAKIIKDSRITEKDILEVKIEWNNSKKNISGLLKSESDFLFPYDFRKLSDLEPTTFEKILQFTKILPRERNLWNESFLYNLDVYKHSETLQTQRIHLSKKVDQTWSYPEILMDYKEKGGTLGGLLNALKKFKEEAPIYDSISQFTNCIEELRSKLYENILDNLFCPSHQPYIHNIEEFEKMSRDKGLKIKTNHMESFQKLKDSIIPGDQLWIFRKRTLVRSYAHIVLVTEPKANKFVHVSAPNLKLKRRARAKIQEDDGSKIMDESFCFIVRPSYMDNIFSKRALICKGMMFDYYPETSNCETFCNGVHGIWESSVQGQDIRGAAQNMVNIFAKASVKTKSEVLTMQMQKTFYEENLTLPREVFKQAGAELCQTQSKFRNCINL